jgi:UDPglucose 6-dehydrogenase
MDACRQQRPELRIRYCDSPREVAADANALVVVTEWQEFRGLDLRSLAEAMATPILVDGRNIFQPQQAAEAGFDYSGIGRCSAGRTARREVGTPAI